MTSRLSQWLRDPLFLLCLTAGLLAFVVQSGELGTADTMHRLQTTHWLWTAEPQVFPNEYPEFGAHGRGGRLYSTYGIGQSLLMLPADLLGTWIAHWPIFSGYSDEPAVRSIVVSYSTSILVNILTALIAFRLLCQLRFGVKESVAGVLALMFCTTHLHYTQNLMENNYIMLLTLTGFSFQYEWLRADSRRALFIGSCALGLNLLTRLTTGLDLIAAGIFVLLTLWFEGARSERTRSEGARGRPLWRRFIAYCKVAAPVYLMFLLLDRAYQFYRFGSFTNTYVAYYASEIRQRDPTLPANFPWNGFFRRVISAGEVYLSLRSAACAGNLPPSMAVETPDPRVARLWDGLCSPVAGLYLLLREIRLLERRLRLGRPLCFHRGRIGRARCRAAAHSLSRAVGKNHLARGMGAIVASLIVQLASLAFWLPLEIYQMETFGHPTFVIALRFKNIVAFALGKMDAWGLNTDAMGWDAWDYVHITTWNFLPFLLRRVGAAPAWVVNSVLAIWIAAVAALGAVLLRLRSNLRTAA
jgi:hypothetical protein